MNKKIFKIWIIYILFILFVFYIDIIFRYKTKNVNFIFLNTNNDLYELNWLFIFPIDLLSISLIFYVTKKIKIIKRIFLISLNIILGYLFLVIIWIIYLFITNLIVF